MPKVQVIDTSTGKIKVRERPTNQVGTITKNSYSEATTLAAAKTSTSSVFTGFVSGSSSTGNTFFNTVWWSSTGIVVWQSAGRHAIVSGFEGTVGQVVGVSVKLIDTYDPLNQGDRSLDVQISLDGGNNFSTAINSGNLGNTSTTDITIGGKTNTWGLTWPSSFDTSNFQVKGTSVNGRVFGKQVQVNFKHSTTTTTEDVPVTATDTLGNDLTDTSKVLWSTNVFNSKKNDTWQMHTTGSHNDVKITFVSENHNWNFIPHNWPLIEGKFNSKTDPDGNTITVTKKIKSWRKA